MSITTSTTTPTRYPERMRADRDTVHGILDEALHCHVAFVVDGAPRVLPTLHVRVGDTLYLHGSTGSRPMLTARDGGLPVSVAVTLVDGLALARSQFHHSVNYRSVVAHGTAVAVTDETTQRRVLAALVDKIAAGRSVDSRPPTAKELAATGVLAMPLTEAAAKVRADGVNDDADDLDLPYWAGVLPLRTVAGEPLADNDAALPEYLHDWRRGAEPPRSPWLTAAPMAGTRVRLEPLSLDHTADLFEAGRDPEVWRYLPSAQPRTVDELAHQVVAAIRAGVAGERVPWALVDLATGRAVGTTSYYDVSPADRRVEIGYTWLGRPWWRTGINTEAKLLLMERAFETLGALRVSWRTDSRNERSRRAVERLGASRDGVLRNHMTRPDGSQRDSVVYSMTDAEWPAARDHLRTRLATA